MSYASLLKRTTVNPMLPEITAKLNCTSCKALDLGAGKLLESTFLLKAGFSVDAVDKDSVSAELAQSLTLAHDEKFKFFHQNIVDFKFKEKNYDLVVSFLTLPFLPPKVFTEVFNKIRDSLRPGGHLCISLFGQEDDWAKSMEGKMTFLNKQQVADLIAPLTLVRVTEEEKEGPTINGDIKHWHIFSVVAKNEN